jgi:hypothetical protein
MAQRKLFSKPKTMKAEATQRITSADFMVISHCSAVGDFTTVPNVLFVTERAPLQYPNPPLNHYSHGSSLKPQTQKR